MQKNVTLRYAPRLSLHCLLAFMHRAGVGRKGGVSDVRLWGRGLGGGLSATTPPTHRHKSHREASDITDSINAYNNYYTHCTHFLHHRESVLWTAITALQRVRKCLAIIIMVIIIIIINELIGRVSCKFPSHLPSMPHRKQQGNKIQLICS